MCCSWAWGANYQHHDDVISPTTRQAIRYGKIIIKNNDEAHRTPEIHPDG
jgi:two-component system LytT family sensor kinase